MGGLGEKHTYIGEDGKTYLFKHATTKGMGCAPGKPCPVKAYASEAGYKIQNIVDPDTAIKCFAETINIDGFETFGSSQEIIETQPTGDIFSQEHAPHMLREFVTDWLLSNYDCNSGNFIKDKDGVLRGIDKEQSFKYIAKKDAQQPNLDFDPEGTFSYKRFFRKHMSGDINIDFSELETYISRVEAIPTEEYMEIFAGYINEVKSYSNTFNPGYGEYVESLIKSRKENLRVQMYDFVKNTLKSEPGFEREKIENITENVGEMPKIQ